MMVLADVGDPLSTVKVCALEGVPTPGLVTVTGDVLAVATSVFKMLAVRIVELTKVVARPLPFHLQPCFAALFVKLFEAVKAVTTKPHDFTGLRYTLELLGQP